MSTSESLEFNGLTMPVFNAFGWIQKDDVIEFALDQLQQFATDLYKNLPRDLQLLFPYYGLDKETQGVYLARTNNISDDIYITFYAKPKSLRMAINMNAQSTIGKSMSSVQENLNVWVKTMLSIMGDWEVTAQQLEVNEKNNEMLLYKELYKDAPKNLSMAASTELIERMIYLQEDPKYTMGFVITKNWPSQFIAGMGEKVGKQIALELTEVAPVIMQLAGGVKFAAKKKETKKRTVAKRQKATSATAVKENQIEQFTYHATLKPLHIRKGFINMTPAHWPFFSKTARTEVRDITVRYETTVDKKSSVWRMVPNDMARIVLSDQTQRWLSNTFSADEQIQINAIKNGDIIELELQQVEVA